MTATCRHCGTEIVMTVYGYGHLTNPGYKHHVPTPRRGDVPSSRSSVASAGRRTATA